MTTSERVTMATVARAAGVSAMTVSMALRNHPRISEATRLRVRETADRVGYRVDPLLSRLMTRLRSAHRTSAPECVAYLVSQTPDAAWRGSYHGLFLRGTSRRAEALGYRLEVLSLKEPGMTDRRMSAVLRHRGIQGAVIAPLSVGGGHLNLDFTHLAVAHIGASLWRPQIPTAHHDRYGGMLSLLRHLMRHGYRRIGLVTNQALARTTEHQEEAAFFYCNARMGQTPIPPLVLNAWDARALLAWFRRHRPEAIATCYLEVRPALEEAGIRVPRDVGVALNWLPPDDDSAGVREDFEAAGAAAFDLVESQLRRHEFGVPTLPKTVLIRGRWIEGGTVRHLP